ncbi:hypothetical protein ACHAXT_006534 [Thalassiosira profunda]
MGKPTKFEGELHVLCAEASWSEVRAVLTSLLEAEGAAQGGDGKQPHTYHRPGTKGRHRASLAPTATTAPSSDRRTATENTRSIDVSDASNSSESWFDEENLGCSYEEILGEGRLGGSSAPAGYSSGEEGRGKELPARKAEEDSASASSSVVNAAPSSTHGDDEGSHCSTHNSDNGMSPERVASLKRQLVAREGQDRSTPLLIACGNAPPDAISLLIRACPNACRIPDRNGRLPLHLATCRKRGGGPNGSESRHTGRNIEVPSFAPPQRRRMERDATPIVRNRYGAVVGKSKRGETQQQQQEEAWEVLQLLIMAHPDGLATTDRWKQTPLHSLFEDRGAGKMGDMADGLGLVQTLLGIDIDTSKKAEEKTSAIQSAVRRALRARDDRGRLPLHRAAACPWANESILRALVEAFPSAAWTPVLPPFQPGDSSNSYEWDVNRNAVLPDDEAEIGLFPDTGGCYGRDLAVHLLHRRYMSAATHHQSPPGAHTLSSGDSLGSEDASVFLNEEHCGAISALLEPIVAAIQNNNPEARLATAATGANGLSASARGGGDDVGASLRSLHSAPGPTASTILPLHIAALHGASFDILSGLCCAYPEGARTPLVAAALHPDRINALPIDLFEEGRAGREVDRTSDEDFPLLSEEYFRRSDLLFSFFPEAVSSKKVIYCHDEARLARFEALIREEAVAEGSEGVLSDMAGSIWLFLCRSAGDPSNTSARKYRPKPNFNAAIGRILDGLEPCMVLPLNFVRTESVPEGVRVLPLANGRTVLEEAKERAPNCTMRQMLGETFFHSSVLSFLDAGDALAYSSTCRRVRARGVRRLPRPLSMETMDDCGEWKLSADLFAPETEGQVEEREGRVSLPWQKLELPFVPSCTHTIFISCDVTYNSSCPEEGRNGEERSAIDCEGGGLLVLREDTARANAQPELVVASTPVKAANKEDGETSSSAQRQPTRVSFSFNHLPGHSYTLWYFGSEGYTLAATNLSVRQLVYSCDYNGHNPLHVLLSGGDNPGNLKEQMQALVSVGFGRDLPVHYALKVGVLERTLRCLVEASPASLLHTDSDRRTPLHAALSGPRMPYLGILRALLTGQGVNATHLKDSSGKLPIHLAAEHGGSEALLRVLVDAYADGCYRRTDEGDLPLHLLVRSGSATQMTVELLLRPIIHNPTICAYQGSLGVNLPLHIAAEYRCQFNIMEGLLSSYSEAAQVQRQTIPLIDASKAETGRKKNQAMYALEIFEEGRVKISLSSVEKTDAGKTVGATADGATQMALGEADFNLRSDLIFVHNPNCPKSSRPYLTTYYRDEKDRIERLAAVVKREASQCSDRTPKSDDAKLTEMARLAWCWMCSNDLYAATVSDIVRSLPVKAVRFLALTTNPKSEPVSDIPIKDCSAPRCALILKSRLSFLGRYVLDRGCAPLHSSESCVVLKAKDIGAMEAFLSIQTLMSDEEPDIDDYSHCDGSVHAIKSNAIEVDRFTHFAGKIGVDPSQALAEIQKLVRDSPLLDTSLNSELPGEQEKPNLKEGVKKGVFAQFCRLHDVDDSGSRPVVIKFMQSKQSYELERQCRGILRESGSKSLAVVPILNHFSFDGDKERDSSDFIRDIYGDGSPSIDLSRMPHGIVMPSARCDLRDLVHREGISSDSLRENARRIGRSLEALHEQGIAHMNLQLSNVLLVPGDKMALSDFGSALFLKAIDGVNAIGGTSTKLCPSIMPPEMIAKIDSSNRDTFDQLMRYWKYTHADASNLKALTPHERQVLSQFVATSAKSPTEKGAANGQKNSEWKQDISTLLRTIQFEDLPRALSKCASLDQFCTVWRRMCHQHDLWERVIRPRVDDESHCAYMIKTFENREDYPPRDAAALPYALVPPSPATDVWIFGIFLYELCSGGNLFHVGYRGELRGADAYSKLYNWTKDAAEKNVKEHIEDPLAQDLLCRILVPAEERLSSMDAVLKHPFFSPDSAEAEHFLEKHEEMQLLRDNTVSIRKVSTRVSALLEDSMEKFCRLGFATEQIAIPTCLVVLPYQLSIDPSSRRPALSTEPRIISSAVQLGQCLLEINKATARLSFWLMMNGKIRGRDGDEFKERLQNWLQRSRHEPCASIAKEIVNGLGCDMNYAMICEEVLALDGSISQAKSYMRDPIRAARRAIKRNSEEICELYQSTAYLYPVDEASLLPHCSSDGSTQAGSKYPLKLQPNPKLIANVLLPFMNVATLKCLASNGFSGLANLLGLPPYLGIPESWLSSEPGLLHSADNSASVEDFTILQKILRKDELQAALDDESISSRANLSQSVGSLDNKSTLSTSALGLAEIDLSPGDPAVAAIPMVQLEQLFREKDPDREFGNLRRVVSGASGSGASKSPGLWTTVDTVSELVGMAEIAEMEERLRELRVSIDETKDAKAQYDSLLKRRKLLMKRKMATNALFVSGNTFDEPSQSLSDMEHDNNRVSEQEVQLEIETRRMPEVSPEGQTPGRIPNDPDPEGVAARKKKKMRKSKRGFRPWFTAC